MTNLYLEDIQFAFKAVEYLSQNHEKVTYWNDDKTLVAMRWGGGNDCIKVLRIEGEVLFLNNCMPEVKLETKVVDEDAVDPRNLEVENKLLREALEYYADTDLWHQRHIKGASCSVPKIIDDKGETARIALHKIK